MAMSWPAGEQNYALFGIGIKKSASTTIPVADHSALAYSV